MDKCRSFAHAKGGQLVNMQHIRHISARTSGPNCARASAGNAGRFFRRPLFLCSRTIDDGLGGPDGREEDDALPLTGGEVPDEPILEGPQRKVVPSLAAISLPASDVCPPFFTPAAVAAAFIAGCAADNGDATIDCDDDGQKKWLARRARQIDTSLPCKMHFTDCL